VAFRHWPDTGPALPRGEQAIAPVTGDSQAVRNIVPDLAVLQTTQTVVKSNALEQLSHFRTAQLFIEFRLTEESDLQQLAFFGLQVGQQAQGFQRFDRHRLCFVDADDNAFFRLRMRKQQMVDPPHQMILIQATGIVDAQFLGQRQEQGIRRQIGIGQIRTHPAFVERLQQPTTEQGLSGADLAGDLDEPLARIQCQQQGIERFLMMLDRIDKAGIRSDPEGQLGKAEMIQVQGRIGSDDILTGRFVARQGADQVAGFDPGSRSGHPSTLNRCG
jgi:hypothetical protein